jgi:hypothetical protein
MEASTAENTLFRFLPFEVEMALTRLKLYPWRGSIIFLYNAVHEELFS